MRLGCISRHWHLSQDWGWYHPMMKCATQAALDIAGFLVLAVQCYMQYSIPHQSLYYPLLGYNSQHTGRTTYHTPLSSHPYDSGVGVPVSSKAHSCSRCKVFGKIRHHGNCHKTAGILWQGACSRGTGSLLLCALLTVGRLTILHPTLCHWYRWREHYCGRQLPCRRTQIVADQPREAASNTRLHLVQTACTCSKMQCLQCCSAQLSTTPLHAHPESPASPHGHCHYPCQELTLEDI